MADECERQAGWTLDFRAGGRLSAVAHWKCPGGQELRVVCWQLRGPERGLYDWARGQHGALPNDSELALGEEWTAGVALERRDSPTGRWSSLRRQELTGADLEHFAARLRGWEAGLLDRAEKLARRERL